MFSIRRLRSLSGLRVPYFYDDAENNIMGTVSLLEALEKNDVKKLLFAFSWAVYAAPPTSIPIQEKYLTKPISPYCISELAGGGILP